MTEEEGRKHIFDIIELDYSLSAVFKEDWWTESLAREFSCLFDRFCWALLDIYHKEIYSLDFTREMKPQIKGKDEELFWHGKKI